MAKTTRSVRMGEETLSKLKALTELLKEDEPIIIERAINMLYDKRQEVFEKDMEERRRLLNKPGK